MMVLNAAFSSFAPAAGMGTPPAARRLERGERYLEASCPAPSGSPRFPKASCHLSSVPKNLPDTFLGGRCKTTSPQRVASICPWTVAAGGLFTMSGGGFRVQDHLLGACEEFTEFVTVEGGRWYVAHTRSRHEKILAQELGRLQIPYYLPLAQKMTRSRTTRRISRSQVPVFPGYLFFNATQEQRYSALRTNRIAHVLEVSDQERLVRELTSIRLLLSTEHDFLVSARLKVGDWGRITSGPLVGLEGVITRLTGRFRLTMNVTILGQSVSIEVDRDTIEKIDPPAFLLDTSATGRLPR